jgi:cytochrome P450
VLVIAGSETTATMLTACTWYLLSSRTPSHDAYARAVAEVRTAFKTTKPEDEKTEITAKAVEAKCPYLVAVLQEALRIFPPVPVGMPRTIGADDGQLVDGVFLPKGTAASVHQLPAGTSPRNFTRPLEFLPERWLSGDKGSEEFQTDKFGARQPFSCGPRNCIGQTWVPHSSTHVEGRLTLGYSLAHVEMRLLLARMLLNFDFELAPGRDMETWRDRCRPFTVWHKPPMLVRLKPADR